MAFEDDIDAAVRTFGTKNLGLVWGVALTNWESEQQRDEFLSAASKTYQE